MRAHQSGGQKISLASLATAVGILGFVGWMAAHAAMPDSLYANGHPAARPTAVATASHAPARSPALKPNLARDG